MESTLLGTFRRVLGLALLVLVALLAVPSASALAHSDHATKPRLESRLLGRGAGYERATGSQPVRVLQRQLRRLGERPGPIDGLFGPLTEAAVVRFQANTGLRTDGIVGRKTATRLARRMASLRRNIVAHRRLGGHGDGQSRRATVNSQPKRVATRHAEAVRNSTGGSTRFREVVEATALLAAALIVLCVTRILAVDKREEMEGEAEAEAEAAEEPVTMAASGAGAESARYP